MASTVVFKGVDGAPCTGHIEVLHREAHRIEIRVTAAQGCIRLAHALAHLAWRRVGDVLLRIRLSLVHVQARRRRRELEAHELLEHELATHDDVGLGDLAVASLFGTDVAASTAPCVKRPPRSGTSASEIRVKSSEKRLGIGNAVVRRPADGRRT